MNKIVLITGATSGIGLGCARKFAENGDKVILTGRNEQRLEEIRKELTEKGCKAITLVFDVRDREKARLCIDSLPEEWKKIDVLVTSTWLATMTLERMGRSVLNCETHKSSRCESRPK